MSSRTIEMTLPSGYHQSRQIFRELASRIGAEPQCLPLLTTDSDELSTDVAYLGRTDAPKLIVIASGTHGVEGYAGAACQFRLMQTYQQRYAHPDIAFLLVHAVNPWGYFHDRRVTQEGIDLNRNFVDFPLAADPSSDYGDYHDLLVAQYQPLPAGLMNELRLLDSAWRAASRKKIRTAVTAGQYQYPDGLFFGGSAPAQSRLIWEKILARYAHDRACTFLLDIHTGLGKRGTGELISYLPTHVQDFQRMCGWFKGGIQSMASGTSVSAAVAGTLTEAFDRITPSQSYAVGLEFGTRSAIAVLYALRADQWVANHADGLAVNHQQWARDKMKKAFAPDDAKWHAQVLERFDGVMDELKSAMSER